MASDKTWTHPTVKEALLETLEFMEARDRMNSAIHCAPVRWSPLTEKVRKACDLIGVQP